MKKLPDIDIDFLNRDAALAHLGYKVASINRDGTRVKHNTGVYVQNIPTDHTNLSSIDYELAEELGYFKLDLLNNSAYQGIDTLDLRNYLSRKEPNWDLLQVEEIVKTLPHIANHYDLVNTLRPDSLLKLAAVLAIIRPAKRYLKDADWDTILREVWVKPSNGEYYWKKSHAIAYSMMVVISLNLICYQADQNSV